MTATRYRLVYLASQRPHQLEPVYDLSPDWLEGRLSVPTSAIDGIALYLYGRYIVSVEGLREVLETHFAHLCQQCPQHQLKLIDYRELQEPHISSWHLVDVHMQPDLLAVLDDLFGAQADAYRLRLPQIYDAISLAYTYTLTPIHPSLPQADNTTTSPQGIRGRGFDLFTALVMAMTAAGLVMTALLWLSRI